MQEDHKEELCLSELYALLQSSVSTLDESPHKSIDTLTLLMEQICSQQEGLQAASPLDVRLEFWRQVNATWLFVIDSILKSGSLQKGDWKVVCETIIAVGNVLYLYGLVDYPMGFAESELLELILSHDVVQGDKDILELEGKRDHDDGDANDLDNRDSLDDNGNDENDPIRDIDGIPSVGN